MIVEISKGNGGQDAGKVEEDRCGEGFLHRLLPDKAIKEVRDVVRDPLLKVLQDALAQVVPVLVVLLVQAVLHGVGLVIDQLPGMAGDHVFEHVFALDGL